MGGTSKKKIDLASIINVYESVMFGLELACPHKYVNTYILYT